MSHASATEHVPHPVIHAVHILFALGYVFVGHSALHSVPSTTCSALVHITHLSPTICSVAPPLHCTHVVTPAVVLEL